MEELYIKDVAKKRGVGIADATRLIDKCIKLVANRLKVPYSDVYNVIYDPLYLEKCLKGSCSDYDLEKCKESCDCLVFENKCYPKKFEDAEKMNEDPDRYVMGMSTDRLTDLVRLASYLYYNFDGGGITDNTFDAFEYHLNKRLKAKGRRYEKIGAPPVDKIRVKLPYGMPSLEKAKPGSRLLYEFLAKPQSKVWSLKLDGVSGQIVYRNGSPHKFYTRGDGTIGGDVTYLKEFISLPAITEEKYKNIVVRGEFILTKKLWLERYKDSYSNARSFVSAKINSGVVTQGLQDIQFVAYEIMSYGSSDQMVDKPSHSLQLLKTLEFNVVDHGTLAQGLVYYVMTFYKEKRASSEYYIDGLVLSLDMPKQSATERSVNPTHTIAFKMRLEEQVRKTKVLNIEWNISRYGRLIPVVIYESVYVDGVRLHRASGHNARRVQDWSLGKGSQIKVVRSGDVIPTIIDVEVNESIEPIYPPTLKPYGSWHWSGADIVLDEIDGNRGVQIKRLEYFFSTIGVPRLGEKTLEKLWDAGFKTVRSITQAKPTDFIKIKGIGKKTAESHYHNIHTTLKNTRIDRFIPASSTLELGIGRKLIKQIMRYHPTLLEEDEDTIKKALTKKAIPGIGKKRIENVAKNIPKFRSFLFDLNEGDIKKAIEKDKERQRLAKEGGYNPKIKGKSFVLTGFFGRIDYELEDYIYDNFGSFTGAVTSGVSAVISANLMESSNKMIDAQRLGVPVLSIEEFVKGYDIPYSKVTEETDEIVIPLEVDEDS